MIIPAAWSQCLDFFGTPLVIEPSPGQLASDLQPVGLPLPFPRPDKLSAPRQPADNGEGSPRALRLLFPGARL